MTPTIEAPLLMPRRLAILLLHEAQIATGPFVGLVSAPNTDGAEPDGWLPIGGMTDIQTLPAQWQAADKRVWAIYIHRPAMPAMPAIEDFSVQPALRRLTASLAIKGVLQLRAWQCLQGRVVECELHIHD